MVDTEENIVKNLRNFQDFVIQSFSIHLCYTVKVSGIPKNDTVHRVTCLADYASHSPHWILNRSRTSFPVNQAAFLSSVLNYPFIYLASVGLGGFLYFLASCKWFTLKQCFRGQAPETNLFEF